MSQEMNRFELPADLRDLERQLAGISPAPAAVNRDQIMYQAGQAAATRSARRRLRLWQTACACLLAACVGLSLATQGAQHPSRVVSNSGVAPVQTVPPVPVPQIAPQITPGSSSPGNNIVAALISAGSSQRPSPYSLDARLSWVTTLGRTGGGGGGGGKTVPTLRPTDGLDALPTWQQKALSAGNRS